MNKKVNDIVFYVLSALFVIIAFVGLILNAFNVVLPTWLAIVLVVVEIALLVTDYFVLKNRKRGE